MDTTSMNMLLHYPFLKEIPEEDLIALDLNVLDVPNALERDMLHQLSAKLNKNIVVYNKLRQAKGNHLCRYLKFAALQDWELSLLKAVEEQFDKDKVIVAYEKPLTFTEPGKP